MKYDFKFGVDKYQDLDTDEQKNEWIDQFELGVRTLPSLTPGKRIDTPLYKIWKGMRARCNHSSMSRSKTYHLNNITVCDRWLGKDGFDKFCIDMGKKPSYKHQIDRIDNLKGYSPDNCRWITPSENSVNREVQENNTTGYRGVYLRKDNGLYRSIAVYKRVRNDLGQFKSKEDAAQAYNWFVYNVNPANCRQNISPHPSVVFVGDEEVSLAEFLKGV